MAGQLTIDSLKASSGVLATQNGMTGIAKAWVNFNGSSAAIRNSFNISSVTKVSTGIYLISFTTNMPSADYVIMGQCARDPNVGGTSPPYTYVSDDVLVPTTSTFRFNTIGTSTLQDQTRVWVAVFA